MAGKCFLTVVILSYTYEQTYDKTRPFLNRPAFFDLHWVSVDAAANP